MKKRLLKIYADPPRAGRVLFLIALLAAMSLPGPGRELSAMAETTEEASADELGPEAKRVVAYLIEDWSKSGRASSIARAMENLGLEPDDRLRFEVGEYLRAHRGLAQNLRAYGANYFILSNAEKILVKAIIFAEERGGPGPTREELAKKLKTSSADVSKRLAFLAETGLLRASSVKPLGFELVEGYARWSGPLGFNFHTVIVEDGKPFDVW